MNKIYFLCIFLMVSCSNREKIIITSDDYRKNVELVTQIMVHDIFSPPVASRIYLYSNIAAYEVIANNSNKYNTLYGQIDHFLKISPSNDKNVDIPLASLIAQMDISRRLIFTESMMTNYRDSLYNVWENSNPEIFMASKAYGLQVVETIAKWMNKDLYKETRSMPKFTIKSDDISRWQPTPPAYIDGIEPSWFKIRPMVMVSSDQFKPKRHPEFSMNDSSEFYKELKEVYNIQKGIFEEGDKSEKLEIAKFWDCNPYVSVSTGHFMFAKKKITPGAHWIGIAKIATRISNNNFEDTVYAYAKTSIALFDSFISCWDEKYRSNLVRPETLINQFIDDEWMPILQTPPFPEYTSGHSVVSGAASTVLTSIFGDNFSFDDDTELQYALPIRHFSSFNQAAEEAAISRLYGGIHYMSACINGLDQGIKLGDYLVKELKMKN